MRSMLRRYFRRQPPTTAAQRAARTRRLRSWSLFIIVPAVLWALWVTLGIFLAWLTSSYFQAGNYLAAVSAAQANAVVSFHDPYLPRFNLGTAYVAAEQYEEGISELELALDAAPNEAAKCPVWLNMSIALEGLGDQAYAEENFYDAVTYYSSAADLLRTVQYSADCPQSSQQDSETETEGEGESSESEGSKGQGAAGEDAEEQGSAGQRQSARERAEQLQPRQDQKLDDAYQRWLESMENDPDADPVPEPEQPADSPERSEQLEKLGEQLVESGRERDRWDSGNRSSNRDYSGEYATKPW